MKLYCGTAGKAGFSNTNGAVQFRQPTSIALAQRTTKQLFVVDSGNRVVRVIAPSVSSAGKTVSTLRPLMRSASKAAPKSKPKTEEKRKAADTTEQTELQFVQPKLAALNPEESALFVLDQSTEQTATLWCIRLSDMQATSIALSETGSSSGSAASALLNRASGLAVGNRLPPRRTGSAAAVAAAAMDSKSGSAGDVVWVVTDAGVHAISTALSVTERVVYYASLQPATYKEAAAAKALLDTAGDAAKPGPVVGGLSLSADGVLAVADPHQARILKLPTDARVGEIRPLYVCLFVKQTSFFILTLMWTGLMHLQSACPTYHRARSPAPNRPRQHQRSACSPPKKKKPISMMSTTSRRRAKRTTRPNQKQRKR